MQTLTAPQTGNSLIHRLDPRVRIITAGIFSLWLVSQQKIFLLSIGLLLALVGVWLARFPLRSVLKRLLPLNFFIVLLWLILPLTEIGQPILFIGISLSLNGLEHALHITLAMNAIGLTLMVLLTSMDIVTLGHALYALSVPEKLIHLFLFTVRYLSVLYNTYQQLTQAMCVRGFRLQMTWHCYRSMGYLLGMLLIRSVERAKRIEMAMKCRGFQGRFYCFHRFHLQAIDHRFMLIFYSFLLFLASFA
ncbi:cobalt ECF transporter T component CbiQ [Beggiatoa leptomitoformis]|uniref:Cobalt ECF transporter T component CbiQ n=1 Tax=Beggiatoa leptomitoformis TaxID=288004 RepID=A0A2N9YE88_9GAMM|nr:cobalt ECF transporter T component CbiQ [Beggiatoa leptomitoformis]ALG68827.1 cobalt ECF transporter T component CbiQ [Beggiatoa leptomitoformis]AUI68808.1 cobalt ECF transporter T component CbiQ [Beggiatoa leptomitoformis]